MKYKTINKNVSAIQWNSIHRHDNSNWTYWLLSAHDNNLFLYNEEDYNWYMENKKVNNEDWIVFDGSKRYYVIESYIFNALFKYDKEQIELDRISELQKVCTHDEIEYSNTYEMRSWNMYCKVCGKDGSREELSNEGVARRKINGN